MNISIIPRVPTQNITPPWEQAFEILQTTILPPIASESDYKSLAPFDQHTAIIEAHWEVGLHWLYKKAFDGKYKIPLKRNLANDFEPFGEMLFRLRELCKECHANPSPESEYYPNAAIWFGLVVGEKRNADIKSIHRLRNERGDGKISYLNAARKDLTQWAGGNLTACDKVTHPHNFRLVTAAINLAGRPDSREFKNRYWNPYLKAHQAFLTSLRASTWKETRVKNNKLVASSGQGLGLVRLLE